MKTTAAHPAKTTSSPTTDATDITIMFFGGSVLVQFPITSILLLIIPHPEMAVI